MRIVNTFISESNDVPHYTKLSLERARKLNPSIEIDFICRSKQYYFDDLNINWIDEQSLYSGELIKEFNSVCSFRRHGTPNTTYPSPELFWHRTAERIFFVQEHITKNKHNNVFHFENDVLIFYPLEYATDISNEKISITDMSPTHSTFAFSHFPHYTSLETLCVFFIELLRIGEGSLINMGYDHISEMSLLNIALRNKLVQSFPTTINEIGTFVYDPGSYGQYFGGTNNGHSSGFIDSSHYIGNSILNGRIHPNIENQKPKTEYNMIFNLHIHSKNLERFI